MQCVRAAGVQTRLLATSVSSTSAVTATVGLGGGDSGTDGEEEEKERNANPASGAVRAIVPVACMYAAGNMLGMRLASNGTEEELPMRKRKWRSACWRTAQKGLKTAVQR